ncbi:TetR/AcrR family transcriptional regulator [Acetobacter sp.]|uniref:TetR/AcrR family transcriptional regulator n=1 Tax=Acetobacter sp. TaxID=440 RepID=UPI0039EC3041
MTAVDLRSPGRPRDDTAGPALLAAARRLVIAHGYEAVSVQMIAAEAQVGRQTLYRRWQGKADLVLEAFLASAQNAELCHADGTTEEKLNLFLGQVFKNLTTDGPAIRSLIASAQSDPDFREIFKQRFVQPRAEIVANIIQLGTARGEIRNDTDIDTAVTMLHGAFWYPLLLGETLNYELAHRIVRLLFEGIGTAKETRNSTRKN